MRGTNMAKTAIDTINRALHKTLQESEGNTIEINKAFVEDIFTYLRELGKLHMKLDNFKDAFLKPLHYRIFNNEYPNEPYLELIDSMIKWSEEKIKENMKKIMEGKH
jgi:hypothetical protein